MLPYLTAQAFGNPSSAHRFGRAARAGPRAGPAGGRRGGRRRAQPGDLHLGRHRGRQPRHRGRGAGRAGPGRRHVRGRLRHRAQGDPGRGPRRLPPGRPRGAAAGGPRAAGSTSTRSTQALAERPAVVSVMWVNNEVGVVQPVARDRRALPGRGRRLPHRRGAGVRQGAGRRSATLRLHPAHDLGPQDRRAQGHRRADRARPQGGRGHHPRRRPAVRHPARHRERGRRRGAGPGGRSWPPPSRPPRPSGSAALRDDLAARLEAAVPDLVVNAERAPRAPHCSASRCRAPTAKRC